MLKSRLSTAGSLKVLACLSATCILLAFTWNQLKNHGGLVGFGRPNTFTPTGMNFVPDKAIPWNDIREPETALREKLATLPRNNDYYNEGVGVDDILRSQLYDPLPDYNSAEWQEQWHGTYQTCRGPRGGDLKSIDQLVHRYGSLSHFPAPILGSNEHIGVNSSFCLDHDSRFAPYRNNRNPPVDWDQVDWGDLQNECFERNRNRYNDVGAGRQSGKKARTAIVYRSYIGVKYTSDLLMNLRAVMIEAGLASGGEYYVVIFVDVSKALSPDDPILQSVDPTKLQESQTRQMLNDQYIPKELHNLTFFFNRDLMKLTYPKVGQYEPMYQIYQPLTYYASLNPQFEHYWHFEMDVRLTGHYYEYLEGLANFAQNEPRDYLWERNSGFYIPSVHGSWSNYSSFVVNATSDYGVRGPFSPFREDYHHLDDGEAFSNKDWGVGEDADVITFIPIFDPIGTEWTMRNVMYNVPQPIPPGYGVVRRGSPVTMGRLSRRLLMVEHDRLNATGFALVSEMSLVSTALWKGFKAVFAHPPNFHKMQWEPNLLMEIFNNGWASGGDVGSGGNNSVWNLEKSWKMADLTFFYRTNFPRILYERWLGRSVDGEGGPEWDRDHGRLCLPPMILHPVKGE